MLTTLLPYAALETATGVAPYAYACAGSHEHVCAGISITLGDIRGTEAVAGLSGSAPGRNTGIHISHALHRGQGGEWRLAGVGNGDEDHCHPHPHQRRTTGSTHLRP